MQQLQAAEDAGQRVWIIAHMPPGRADVLRDQVRSEHSFANHSQRPISVKLLQPDCATVPQYYCWTILWPYPHGQLHLATRANSDDLICVGSICGRIYRLIKPRC